MKSNEILDKKCTFQSGKKLFFEYGIWGFGGREECIYTLTGIPVKKLSKGIYLLDSGHVVLEEWLVKVEK